MISRNTILDAYSDTYRAHLEAMNVELVEAERIGGLDWMMRRCKDLEEYLSDPYLPHDLEPVWGIDGAQLNSKTADPYE